MSKHRMNYNLKSARESAGLTYRAAAALLDVSHPYIVGLEVGRNNPGVWDLLRQMATVYGCTTDYLLGLADNPGGHVEHDAVGLYYRLSNDAQSIINNMVQRLLLRESAEYRAQVFRELIQADPAARDRLVSLLDDANHPLDTQTLTFLQEQN